MLLHRCILYAQMQGHHMHILNFHAQRKEVVEHWSMEYEGLRFNSPWRLRFFFLSHDCYKTKNIFLYLFTKVKNYLSPILKSTEDAIKFGVTLLKVKV